MRDHLVHCLEKQHFDQFPRLDAGNITTLKPFKYESKEILFCVCRMLKDKTMALLVGSCFTRPVVLTYPLRTSKMVTGTAVLVHNRID